VTCKVCKTCQQKLSLDCFSKGNGKHKKLNVCRTCDALRRRKYHASLTDEQKAQKAVTQRICDYKRVYGLPDDMAQQLANNREGSCEICGETKFLVVDHCHTSSVVRGLLCQQCNSVLGYAKDNVETLLNAVSYLRKHYGWANNS
jgi:hypothetical protein